MRIATHCTEADVAAQHIAAARNLGMDVAGFLMMAHMASPAELARQAMLMESYGVHCVYVTDSAGAMTPNKYLERIDALRAALKPTTQVGVHSHQNLSMSVANSLGAIEHGAIRVDASLAGMGAGAGNTPIEAFIAALERETSRFSHGCDLYKLMDAADDYVGRSRIGRSVSIGKHCRWVMQAFIPAFFATLKLLPGPTISMPGRSLWKSANERWLGGKKI